MQNNRTLFLLKTNSPQKVLYVCIAAYTVSYLCRTNLSCVLDDLLVSLNITKSMAGLLNTVYFWIYAVGQLFSVLLVTKYNPKKIVVVGLILTAISNLGIGFCNSYIIVLLLWSLNGFALSLFWAPIMQIVAGWITAEEYTKISILLNLPTTVGYILSWSIFGVVKSFTSWRVVFILPSIIAMLFCIYWVKVIPNKPMIELKPTHIRTQEAKKDYSLKGVFSFSMITFGFMVFTQGSTKESINMWAPTLLRETSKVVSTFIISGFSTIIPIFSTIGLLLTWYLSSKFHNSQSCTLMILVIVDLLSGWILFFQNASFILSVVMLGIMLGAMYGINTILTTLIPLQFAKTGKHAQISGIFNFLAYVGAALGSFISGAISNSFSWRSVYLMWAILNTIVFVTLLISESIKYFKIRLSY